MRKLLSISFVLVFSLCAFAQTTDSTALVTINKILIEGNKKTKPQIITRELSFEEGGQYKRYKLDSMFVWDRNRIYNYNLFNDVTFSLEPQSEGSANVRIIVDERWYFYPIPIFKLIDRNFNDWWINRGRDLSRVNIGLKLTQYNFRGRAERLRTSMQFGYTTRINLSYRIPYIDKKQRHGLDFDLNYLETKNLAFTTNENVRTFLETDDLLRSVYRNKITHSYRSSFYSFHHLILQHTSVSIADTITALNPNYLEGGETHQKYFNASYAYTWDHRNNVNYPTEGSWHSASVSKYGLGIHDDVDFFSVDFRLSKYWALKNNYYFAGNAIGVVSFPEDRGYFNYFAIGFRRNVLRGYDLTIVEGSTFFIQKNEFKKKLFSYQGNIKRVMPIKQFQSFPVTLFGKVFFDQGYAKGFPNYTGSDLLDDRYLYSYGVGLDLMIIYDAVFRFELSRNTLGETNFFINFGTAL